VVIAHGNESKVIGCGPGPTRKQKNGGHPGKEGALDQRGCHKDLNLATAMQSANTTLSVVAWNVSVEMGDISRYDWKKPARLWCLNLPD
jgi:hypothetical protein